MASLSKEKKIYKLESLINEGKGLFVTRSYVQQDFSYDGDGPTIQYYSDVNHDEYPGWRMNSLAVLESFLGPHSKYLKEYEENCKSSSNEQNLRQGIGVLQAVKKGYEEGIISQENSSSIQNSENNYDINKQSILRRLFNEFATSLSSSLTFNQIAKVFFETGIIDTPEKPYGVYQGSKADYVLDKLLNAQNKSGFPEMLSAIQFDLCYSSDGPSIDDKPLYSLMKLLGYTRHNNNPDPSLIAPNVLPQVSENNKSSKRISIDNLPSSIQELINELNDNIERGNVNACALLIRKILTLSCFIALDKIGKSIMLDEKELSDALSIVQKELKISHIVMAKVKSSKWIGDSANHSYKLKINESDVELAATGLRIFLEEVF